MVFSSVIFLFAFFPLFLLVYFACPVRGRNLILLLTSLLFYTWGEQVLVVVMLSSTVVDYICGLVIAREREHALAGGAEPGHKTRGMRIALWVSLAFNLTLLCVFKYFNFAMDNYNALMSAVGLEDLVAQGVIQVILPLGISFYTFQSLSYTIDCYRGTVKPARNLIDFACFVTMFPQLIAGPIVRYRDVEKELVLRTATVSDFAAGIRQFMVGLGKKMLIANVVAEPVDAIFALPHDQISFTLAWTAAFLFSMQLFYDFAGYSDMAIGMGRMLGFKFPKNFNYPYISKTIAEFWQRWHITLSSWLRDYLFTPLGGYRRGRRRGYLNLIIVFTLCGLWHGASWNFVLFGFNMGALIVMERILKSGRNRFFTGRCGHLYMFMMVGIHMVIFRSESVATITTFLGAMFGFARPVAETPPLGFFADHELILIAIVSVLGSIPTLPALQAWWTRRIAGAGSTGRATAWRLSGEAALFLSFAAIFLLCAMKLAAGTYNPFIYFRF